MDHCRPSAKLGVGSWVAKVKTTHERSIEPPRIVANRHQPLADLGVPNADNTCDLEVAVSSVLVFIRHVHAGLNTHPEGCVSEVQADLSVRSVHSDEVLGDVHGAHVGNVDQSLDEAIELGVTGGCKGLMVGWDGTSGSQHINVR